MARRRRRFVGQAEVQLPRKILQPRRHHSLSQAGCFAWASATVGARLYADYAAGQSLKPLITDGRRLVPVRQHEHMRGDVKRDYHCFGDGLCIYAIDVFRRLYPAYNDLDDDALLHELRGRNALP